MSLEQVDRIRAMLNARRGETLSIDERRARFEMQAQSAALPADVQFTPATINLHLGGLWIDCNGAHKHRVLLWLHGGAFMLGSSQSYRDFGARVAKSSGIRVLLLDYRLVPEHPFPAALDDTVATLAWLEQQGYASDHIATGGDSAGGNLALAAVQMRITQGHAAPAGLWVISPYLDLTHSGASIARRAHLDPFIDPAGMPATAALYLGHVPPDDPLASPLFGSMANLPPALIQVGSDEVLFDDSRRLAFKLEAGNTPVIFQEWVGMIHVWPLFAARIDEGQSAIAQGGNFIMRHLL